MPVAVVGTIPGMTVKQYDEIMEDVSDHMMDKAHMHFMHKHGDGLRMVEIWPDQEHLDEFMGMVQPWMAKFNLTPEIEVVPVHNHFHKHKAHK